MTLEKIDGGRVRFTMEIGEELIREEQGPDIISHIVKGQIARFREGLIDGEADGKIHPQPEDDQARS